MIYLNKLKSKLVKIFLLLDFNGNGYISAEEIELDQLPSNILLILKPLLVELEQYEEKLNLDEFINSSLLLIEVSTKRVKKGNS